MQPTDRSVNRRHALTLADSGAAAVAAPGLFSSTARAQDKFP